MPAGYVKMRNKFYKEKKAEWYRKHPHENMSKATDKKIYDNAQTKAARIHNSQHPKNPVGRGD